MNEEIKQLLIQLTELLLTTGHTVVTAESCTGGLLSGLLTDLSGSSQWFERGFVTYSNSAKQEMLGVNPLLLATHGAVSQPVAEAMVLGALQHSHASIAVAVTGIAGPDGGSLKKPVGTVYLAFSGKSFPLQCQQYCFPGSRQEVRQLACRQALAGLIKILAG